jgi:hypothetical protein
MQAMHKLKKLRVVAMCASAALFGALSACTAVAPRAASSSYGCMAAVVRDHVPPTLPDKRAHCLASGLIARHCSVGEAYMAGAGKEIRDLFGHGDAEWADWQADRRGIACARRSSSDEQVAECCKATVAAGKLKK